MHNHKLIEMVTKIVNYRYHLGKQSNSTPPMTKTHLLYVHVEITRLSTTVTNVKEKQSMTVILNIQIRIPIRL